MADPICRWRNPTLPTVTELINLLPKEELMQDRAREIVNNNSPYDFYRTPYQLACQLGLYYEFNGRYFPKFTYNPTEEEILEYLKNWIVHYCIPNPYTRGFDGLEPFSIHAEICRRLRVSETPLPWNVVRDEIFQGQIGNNDILVNSLNYYSPVIAITAGDIHLKHEIIYENLDTYIEADISHERNNKEYFFDLFVAPNRSNITQNLENLDVVTNITREETNIINQLQNNPNLTQTEKNQIVAARIGQGLFRRNLINDCRFCPITGVDDSRFLVASHIKPWRFSDNTERLSVSNGLLFTPTYDKLFDKGYISFTNNKEIIVSDSISEENKVRFNLVAGTEYPLLPLVGRIEFLNYHRDNIFQN